MDSSKLFSIKVEKKKKKPTSHLDLTQDDIGELIALNFNKKAYHTYLNKLDKSLRPFIYDDVISDNYYLVFDINSGIIIGGFSTCIDGNMNGLFSLIKGQGKKIFKLQLQHSTAKELTIFCIGDKLRSLYESFNFKVKDTIEWNDELAPKNWNYERFGKPDLYIMRKMNEK